MAKQFISSAGVSAANEPKLASPNKFGAFLIKINEWVVLVAAALIPLFFLPFTSQALELPKQVALLVLVTIIFLSWVGSMLIEKAIVLRRTIANLGALIFLGVMIVATLFSNAKYISGIGDGGEEYVSLATTALFVFLFFAIVNLPARVKIANKVILVFIVVTGLAALQAFLSYAGLNVLPFIKNQSFNFVGSTVTLGLLSAVAVVATATYFLVADLGKNTLAKRIVAGVFGFFSLLIVLVINFWPIWVAVIVGLVALLAYALVRPRSISRLTWLAVPMGVLVLAALFLFVNVPLPVRAPVEIFPSTQQSFKITGEALKSSPILGSGPGTFADDFSRFRDTLINKSSVWYVRFDRANSFLLTLAATTGFAGLIAWLFLVVIGLWKSAAYLIFGKERDDANWLSTLGLTAAFLASVAGMIFYGASLATLFVFWVVFALLMRAVSKDSVTIRFSDSPRAALGMTFFFVLTVILFTVGWFVTGTKLYADTLSAKAGSRDASKQIDLALGEFEKAASANGQSDLVLRNLAQAYLIKIQALLYDQTMDATARGKKINDLTMAAINTAKQATVISSKNVQNWSLLGAVYETISAYVSDAPENAIAAYNQAVLLEPASPVQHLGLGRVHMILANRASTSATSAKDDAAKAAAQKVKTDELAAAEAEFGKALELKSDYAQASYQLAVVYERQGKANEAIKKLEEVATQNPNDAGVVYSLGLMYYLTGTKDKAEAALTRAIAIDETYADARWLLATVYEDAKKYSEALTQLNAILKTDPENATVKTRVDAVTAEMNGKAPTTPDKGTPTPLPEKSRL